MIITDQLNRKIKLTQTPERIVSLVTSITKTFYDLELNDEVVGITRFCKLPEHWRKEKTIIGGTKDIKIDRIRELQPDIILANKEENTKENIEQLEKIAPVYVSNVSDLCSNNIFLKDMGIIFNKQNQSERIILSIAQKRQVSQQTGKKIKTAYFIWKKPWMSIGGDTFIHQMLREAGLENVYKNKTRYPEVNLQDLQKLKPELILLSSEPYPFKEKHRRELQLLFPDTTIKLVEGEAFTWFGSEPQQGLSYIQNLNL